MTTYIECGKLSECLISGQVSLVLQRVYWYFVKSRQALVFWAPSICIVVSTALFGKEMAKCAKWRLTSILRTVYIHNSWPLTISVSYVEATLQLMISCKCQSFRKGLLRPATEWLSGLLLSALSTPLLCSPK